MRDNCCASGRCSSMVEQLNLYFSRWSVQILPPAPNNPSYWLEHCDKSTNNALISEAVEVFEREQLHLVDAERHGRRHPVVTLRRSAWVFCFRSAGILVLT